MAKTKASARPSTFTWSGLDKGSRKTSGEIEASNIQVARLLLRRQGIRVKKIRKQTQSILSLGQKVKVKVVEVDQRGRIRLSMKELEKEVA